MARVYWTNDRILKKTDDEGDTWDTLYTNASAILAIMAWDAGQTLVLVDTNTIERSANGGASFTTVHTSTNEALDLCKSPDSDYVFGSAMSGRFYKTTNKGLTWTETNIAEAGSQHMYGIHFVSDTVGWMCGNNARIVKTTDGGSNWTQQTVPGVQTDDLKDIFFIDASNGWCTFDQSSRGILRTTDGGTNWTEETLTGKVGRGKCVHAVSSTYVWTTTFDHITQDIEVFRSTDGGQNWNRVVIDTAIAGGGASWADIFFTNTLAGFMGAGKYYKSTNGGSIWVQSATDPGTTNVMYSKGYFDITFSVQFREFDITGAEPADRTTEGSAISSGNPLAFGASDAGDTVVKCVIFRVSSLGLITTITNMKFYLEDVSEFAGTNSYYADITDAWTQDKTVGQVSGGTPGTCPQALPSANVTKLGGGDITGIAHADTSQYIYLALNIGGDENTGAVIDFNYRLTFDYS